MGLQAIIPTYPAKPAEPARQASQPGQPVIEASGLQASMSAILLYRGSSPPLKGPTGRHRPPQAGNPLDLQAFLRVPQAATGRHRPAALWISNTDDMATFPTNRVMGRLWDDHFMDSGYPSKFCRVQDAISIDGSLI